MALADRLAHRSISTLELISDNDFEAGQRSLRAAATADPGPPFVVPNTMLEFRRAR